MRRRKLHHVQSLTDRLELSYFVNEGGVDSSEHNSRILKEVPQYSEAFAMLGNLVSRSDWLLGEPIGSWIEARCLGQRKAQG